MARFADVPAAACSGAAWRRLLCTALGWTQLRDPYLLESDMAGVFVAGEATARHTLWRRGPADATDRRVYTTRRRGLDVHIAFAAAAKCLCRMRMTRP